MDQDFINWAEARLGNPVTASKVLHGDEGVVYKLETGQGNFFLKIAPKLINERDRLIWSSGRLPVPQVIDFLHTEDRDALLLSAIEGKRDCASQHSNEDTKQHESWAVGHMEDHHQDDACHHNPKGAVARFFNGHLFSS